MFAILLASAALGGSIISGFPTHPSDAKGCLPYADFTTQIASQGAKLSTIETATFPNIKRMMVVTFEGNKEVFAGLDQCVLFPPLFVDAVKDHPAIIDPTK